MGSQKISRASQKQVFGLEGIYVDYTRYAWCARTPPVTKFYSGMLPLGARRRLFWRPRGKKSPPFSPNICLKVGCPESVPQVMTAVDADIICSLVAVVSSRYRAAPHVGDEAHRTLPLCPLRRKYPLAPPQLFTTVTLTGLPDTTVRLECCRINPILLRTTIPQTLCGPAVVPMRLVFGLASITTHQRPVLSWRRRTLSTDRHVDGDCRLPALLRVQVEGAESRSEVEQGLDHDPLVGLGHDGVEVRQ